MRKIKKMSTLKTIFAGILLSIVAVGAAFGQTEFKGRTTGRHLLAAKSSAAAESIKAEYVNSYYIGYDIVSIKEFIRKDEIREAMAQLAVLWDEL